MNLTVIYTLCYEPISPSSNHSTYRFGLWYPLLTTINLRPEYVAVSSLKYIIHKYITNICRQGCTISSADSPANSKTGSRHQCDLVHLTHARIERFSAYVGMPVGAMVWAMTNKKKVGVIAQIRSHVYYFRPRVVAWAELLIAFRGGDRGICRARSISSSLVSRRSKCLVVTGFRESKKTRQSTAFFIVDVQGYRCCTSGIYFRSTKYIPATNKTAMNTRDRTARAINNNNIKYDTLGFRMEHT